MPSGESLMTHHTSEEVLMEKRSEKDDGRKKRRDFGSMPKSEAEAKRTGLKKMKGNEENSKLSQ